MGFGETGCGEMGLHPYLTVAYSSAQDPAGTGTSTTQTSHIRHVLKLMQYFKTALAAPIYCWSWITAVNRRTKRRHMTTCQFDQRRVYLDLWLVYLYVWFDLRLNYQRRITTDHLKRRYIIIEQSTLKLKPLTARYTHHKKYHDTHSECKANLHHKQLY